jgi:hypothetical protein
MDCAAVSNLAYSRQKSSARAPTHRGWIDEVAIATAAMAAVSARRIVGPKETEIHPAL